MIAEYTNESGLQLRLFEGDIRTHKMKADVIIFGRNQELRQFYFSQSQKYFLPLNPFYLKSIDLQANPLCLRLSENQGIISTRYNPKVSSSYPVHAFHHHMSQHIHQTLIDAIRQFQARHIALVPLTWRFPEETAFATIISIWNISIDRYFRRGDPLSPETEPPHVIDLVSLTGIDEFKRVLDHGQYARLRYLKNTWPLVLSRRLYQNQPDMFQGNRSLPREDVEYLRHNRFRFEAVAR